MGSGTDEESSATELRGAFDAVFGRLESRVRARVWSEVLGQEYPAELAPYSFTSRSELVRISAGLRVSGGDLLVDVGAGRGGPGLWIAATTGAAYCAVDIAPSVVAEVPVRAEQLGLGERTRSAVGDFEDLPLVDDEAAAVLSIDALLFTPDKGAAARELARVLRPGGRLVLTTWDYSRQPLGRPPQVSDHRPLLAAAGFDVLVYEQTPDWQRRQHEIDRRLLASVDELAAEEGTDPAQARAAVQEMAATVETMLRRVLVVARRR